MCPARFEVATQLPGSRSEVSSRSSADGSPTVAVGVVVLLGAVACLRLPRTTVVTADAEVAPLGVV